MASDISETKHKMYTEILSMLGVDDENNSITIEKMETIAEPDTINPIIESATKLFRYTGKKQNKEMSRTSLVKLLNCVFEHFGKKVVATKKANYVVGYKLEDDIENLVETVKTQLQEKYEKTINEQKAKIEELESQIKLLVSIMRKDV
jgi:hypothetical protein